MSTDKHRTILIAGGAGFIGSHLVEKYLCLGHRVIVIDNLQTTWKPKNIERFFADPNFRFIRKDITDPIRLNERVDWIFNCACAGSYTSYQFNPVHTVKTNTVGMINLLELAKKDGARILQTSTSEIYGDPLETPQKETYHGNVNPLGPRACYDEGKRVAETLCMDYHREFGIDVKIVRIFNTYGPNMDPNDGRAVTNFIRNALSGKDLVVYGDGSQTRSFQYIDDLIEGLDAMMQSERFVGPVNLGNPGEITMRDLAEQIITLTKSSAKIVYSEGATDDPKRRSPDISLAMRELHWSPKVSLKEGLKRTVDYFQKIEWPEKKILVFATTYHPDLGPAEKALFELSILMPDTEFHIVTTKFRKGVPEIEEVGTDTVHRVGIGSWLDKYLLPFLGLLKAQQLKKEHQYRFVWSIMGSYSGMAALFFKLMNRETNLLMTLDDKEVRRKGIKAKLLSPIYRMVLSASDSIYISNIALAEGKGLLEHSSRVTAHEGDIKSMVNKVRYTYADLLNKQEKKLSRPK